MFIYDKESEQLIMNDNILKKPKSLFEFKPVKLNTKDFESIDTEGYKSPLDIIIGEIQAKLTEQAHDIDKLTYEAVQNVGISVDKDELIKALQYDRDQYDIGYRKGYYAGQQDKWMSCYPPEVEGRYTVTFKDGTVGRCYYGQDDRDVWMWYDTSANPVIAWLANPIPYRGMFDYE